MNRILELTVRIDTNKGSLEVDVYEPESGEAVSYTHLTLPTILLV